MGETCKDTGGRNVCDRVAWGCKNCQNMAAHVSPGGGEGSERGACRMWRRLRKLWQGHQGVLGLPGRLCCPLPVTDRVKHDPGRKLQWVSPHGHQGPGQLHGPPHSWRSPRSPATPVGWGDHWQEVWVWRLSSNPGQQLSSPERIMEVTNPQGRSDSSFPTWCCLPEGTRVQRWASPDGLALLTAAA